MLKTQAFAAGETKEFKESADFFRILSAGGPVDVTFIRNGALLDVAEGVSPGYAERWEQPFDAVMIRSASAQNVQFVMRRGAIAQYDIQSLIFPAKTGAMTQVVQAIGVASAIISAANANRKYFAIHNTSANTVYINLSGAACTVANGIAIQPGQFFSLVDFLPAGDITAIATVASNVIEIEG